MKRIHLYSLFVCVFICATAHAGPKRVLTAVPRAYGRTVANMFTFKQKGAAIQEWITLGAVIADVGSTSAVEHRCPACQELSPVYGPHPSGARLGLFGALDAMSEATVIQYEHELLPGSKWNLINLDLPAIHTGAAIHNSLIK